MAGKNILVFGGVRYHFGGDMFSTKLAADKEADYLRRHNGYSIRVVKRKEDIRSGLGKNPPMIRTRYLIYVKGG